MSKTDLKSLSDDELLVRLSSLSEDSRRIESALVAHIAEVDARKLYAREATPSMHKYCVDVLHLSDAEAYFRITAARASRPYPVLLTMLEEGGLHLSGIEVLAPHLDGLSKAECDELLTRAIHKTKRVLKELVAELAPKPDVPPRIRSLCRRNTSAPRGNSHCQCRGSSRQSARRPHALLFTFARVSAVVALKVEDVLTRNGRMWIRLEDKGGKVLKLPAQSELQAYVAAYLDTAAIRSEKKSPLFRAATAKTGALTSKPMSRADVYRMIQRPRLRRPHRDADQLSHVSRHGHYAVFEERWSPGSRSGNGRARNASNDGALRPEGWRDYDRGGRACENSRCDGPRQGPSQVNKS